jgi:hypothetical protein
VVAVVKAKFLKGGAEGWGNVLGGVKLRRACRLQCDGLHVLTSCASATQAQSEDAHGHYTAAFPAVDVGVIGEDVGNWLGGVRLESHCECCGGCGGGGM